jgi:hypothetical protein
MDLHIADAPEPLWHWLHPDLDVKHWYRQFGSSIDFDFIFEYEWDLLTTDALTSIVPDINQDTIALCSLTRLTPDIEHTWQWTAWPEYRPDYERFLAYMTNTFGMGPLQYVSHGPGPVLSRRFLDRFAEAEDFELVHSEITYPAYAQSLGFQVVNNNFRLSAVTDPREDEYFNSDSKMISYERIASEFVKRDGRRAFHPVRYPVAIAQLLDQVRVELSESQASLHAIHESRAWRTVTRLRKLKQHVTVGRRTLGRD